MWKNLNCNWKICYNDNKLKLKKCSEDVGLTETGTEKSLQLKSHCDGQSKFRRQLQSYCSVLLIGCIARQPLGIFSVIPSRSVFLYNLSIHVHRCVCEPPGNGYRLTPGVAYLQITYDHTTDYFVLFSAWTYIPCAKCAVHRIHSHYC